jgi:hypothetical protein
MRDSFDESFRLLMQFLHWHPALRIESDNDACIHPTSKSKSGCLQPFSQQNEMEQHDEFKKAQHGCPIS